MGLSIILKLWICFRISGRGVFCMNRSVSESRCGLCRSENVGLSSENVGENFMF
jgi:hypothetical protein